MPLLIVIPLVLLTAVLIFLAIASRQPAHFRLERSLVVNAPPAQAFAQVNRLKAWQFWSPWEGMDPSMQRHYSGPDEGQGASYRWVGNKKVGEGSMTITQSQAPSLIRMDLEFIRPFKARNVTEFAFIAQGDKQTLITWSMTGSRNLMFKAMALLIDTDQLVGRDFERGLKRLQVVAEA